MTNSPQFEKHSKRPIRPLPPLPSSRVGSFWPRLEQSAKLNLAQSTPEDAAKAEVAKPRSTPYAVRQQGPLTYFDVYFEDPAFAQTARMPLKAPPLRLNRRVAIVAGGVSVAVASGLVIGETMTRSEAQADKTPTHPTRKPQSPTRVAPAARVMPERLETERSRPGSPASSPDTTRSGRTEASQDTTAQTWRSLQRATAALPTAIAPPERLSALPQATPPDNSMIARTGRSLEGMQVSSTTAKKQPKKSSVSSPQPPVPQQAIAMAQDTTLQDSSAPNPASQSPAAPEPKRLSEGQLKAEIAAEGVPQPDPVATSSPDRSAMNGELSKGPEAEQSGPASSVQRRDEQPFALLRDAIGIDPARSGARAANAAELNQQTRGTAELQTGGKLNRENRTARSQRPEEARENAIAPANQPASEPVPTLPQRLQDYLRPAAQASAEPVVNLLPLTAKAAAEASTTQQIGPFKVRQVNQQEYQKEWLASNKTVADPAIAYAFPAYGFIDYQRQMIIVLGAQPDDQTPLQSQKTTVPRS